MERPRESELGATLLMIPQVASEPVQVVNLGGPRARGWRWVTAGLATLVVVLGVALSLTWPRASAYSSMMEENFALKASLESIERKMTEVDRILLRMRLYDAQLESLGGAGGDHGPLPEGAPMAGDGLDRLVGGEPLMPYDSEEEQRIRPAAVWARGIEARASTFLRMFASVEPDLTVLVEEMESLDALDRALPSFWPAAGFMTSSFGWRRNPMGYQWRHHSGVDVGGQIGDPVWAAAAGTVVYAGWNGSYGKAVKIDHGFGVVTLYAHCSQLLVEEGQRVRRGQRIALIGDTGRSTGPHLHFEVRLDNNAVDPLDYLPRRRGWVPPWRSGAGD